MDKNAFIKGQKKILKGVLAAAVITAAGLIAAGVLMTFTEVSQKSGSYIIMAAVCAGSFALGLAAASAAGRRGLLVGLAAGGALSAAALAAYILFFGMLQFSSLRIMPLLLFPVCGAAGGFFSVLVSEKNSDKKK